MSGDEEKHLFSIQSDLGGYGDYTLGRVEEYPTLGVTAFDFRGPQIGTRAPVRVDAEIIRGILYVAVTGEEVNGRPKVRDVLVLPDSVDDVVIFHEEAHNGYAREFRLDVANPSEIISRLRSSSPVTLSEFIGQLRHAS